MVFTVDICIAKLLTGCLGIMAHNRPMPRAQPEAEVDYENHNS